MAVSEQSPWILTSTQRDHLVARIRACTSCLLTVKGTSFTDDNLEKLARKVESTAYATAQAQATTTTGARPKQEIITAYVRKISQLVMEQLAKGESLEQEPERKVVVDENGRFDISGMATRDFITAEEAKELFQPLMVENNGVRSIKFSDRSFDVGAAKVAAEALLKCADTLQEADLSDIVPGRAEEIALQVYGILSTSLAKCTKLTSLDISHNAMGEKGFRQFKPALQALVNLQELQAQNIGCSVETCTAMSELIASNQLRSLTVTNNMMGDEGASALIPLIQRNRDLTSFVMVSTRVQEEGLRAILNAFSACPNLRRFEIGDNCLTSEGADDLFEFLKSHTKLQVLNVIYNSLEDEGVSSLVRAVREGYLKELKEIRIRAEEELSESVFIQLVAALASCEKLEILDFGENCLENKRAIILCKALEKCKGPLRVLDLSENMIGRIGARAIVQLAIELRQKGNSQLDKLNLNQNQISDEGVEELIQMLKEANIEPHFMSLEDNEEDEESEEEEDLDLDRIVQLLDGFQIQ
eukprot:TRINITY_DN1289_c0_g1_i3.p1 TRINITY_DN1289_c0_g1~~TRINITY_DN1289_c0_g1_i3.p1  ORF type:complete len:537 (-),score=89.07 TRINITY_DN1289_c0_g1_i3:194-1783(-)